MTLEAHGLTAPERLLYPAYTAFVPLRGGLDRADLARRVAERAAQRRDALTAATEGWEAARAALAGNAPALAVLDLHRPVSGGDGPVCAECAAAGEWGYADSMPWECPTYKAVTSS